MDTAEYSVLSVSDALSEINSFSFFDNILPVIPKQTDKNKDRDFKKKNLYREISLRASWQINSFLQ